MNLVSRLEFCGTTADTPCVPSATTITEPALDLNDRRIAALTPVQRTVLRRFIEAGGRGLIDSELAAAMPGLLASSLTKHRLALRVAGLVTATNGRRPTGNSSASAVVYRATV